MSGSGRRSCNRSRRAAKETLAAAVSDGYRFPTQKPHPRCEQGKSIDIMNAEKPAIAYSQCLYSLPKSKAENRKR